MNNFPWHQIGFWITEKNRSIKNLWLSNELILAMKGKLQVCLNAFNCHLGSKLSYRKKVCRFCCCWIISKFTVFYYYHFFAQQMTISASNKHQTNEHKTNKTFMLWFLLWTKGVGTLKLQKASLCNFFPGKFAFLFHLSCSVEVCGFATMATTFIFLK